MATLLWECVVLPVFESWWEQQRVTENTQNHAPGFSHSQQTVQTLWQLPREGCSPNVLKYRAMLSLEFSNFWVLGFSALILCLSIIIIWIVILWPSHSEHYLGIRKDSSKRLEGKWRTQTENTKHRMYEADHRVHWLVAVQLELGHLSVLSSGCPAQSRDPQRGKEGGEKPRCLSAPRSIQEPDTDLSTL